MATLGAMSRDDFMRRIEAFIDVRIAATLDDMHRTRHFAARSAGQQRRRQRERAERTAPNLKIAEV